LSLHEHARFLLEDLRSVQLLENKENQTSPFEWPIREASVNSYHDSFCLEIRYLDRQVARWMETLQGCMWLIHAGNCWGNPGAEVICRSEMVMPLIQTVRPHMWLI
jgi:hypothetical protein